jgi:hypothetical protein
MIGRTNQEFDMIVKDMGKEFKVTDEGLQVSLGSTSSHWGTNFSYCSQP